MTFTVLWRPSEKRVNSKATIVFPTSFAAQRRCIASAVALGLKKCRRRSFFNRSDRIGCTRVDNGVSTPRAATGRVQHPEITRDCSLYVSLTGSPLWVKNQSADPHLLQSNRPNRISSPPILAGPNGSSNLPNSRREIQRRKHQAAWQNFTDQTGAHDELRYTYLAFRIVWL
jgi:hypothetical protein